LVVVGKENGEKPGQEPELAFGKKKQSDKAGGEDDYEGEKENLSTVQGWKTNIKGKEE